MSAPAVNTAPVDSAAQDAAQNDPIRIDARGLSCPQPVLLVLERLRQSAPPSLDVLVDNDASQENVTRAARHNGYTVHAVADAQAGHTRLHLAKE